MKRLAFTLATVLAAAVTVPAMAASDGPPSDTSECLAGSVTLRGDRTNRLGQTRTVWITKGTCPNGYQLVVRYKTPWGQPYVELQLAEDECLLPRHLLPPECLGPTPVPPGTPGQK